MTSNKEHPISLPTSGVVHHQIGVQLKAGCWHSNTFVVFGKKIICLDVSANHAEVRGKHVRDLLRKALIRCGIFQRIFAIIYKSGTIVSRSIARPRTTLELLEQEMQVRVLVISVDDLLVVVPLEFSCELYFLFLTILDFFNVSRYRWLATSTVLCSYLPSTSNLRKHWPVNFQYQITKRKFFHQIWEF